MQLSKLVPILSFPAYAMSHGKIL